MKTFNLQSPYSHLNFGNLSRRAVDSGDYGNFGNLGEFFSPLLNTWTCSKVCAYGYTDIDSR